VRDPRAYLIRVVTRQALNRLRTLSRSREDYVGEWLPEPLLTSPDVAEDVELAESVSIAMLTVLETLGPAERFGCGKQVGSYFGLIPSEHSSGGRQKLGHISKQGSAFLRFLLVEAGQTAVRYDPELGRFYRRLAARKHRALAKVAVARKLATRLYLMLREDWNYAQLCQAVVQVSPSHSVVESKDRPLE